MRKSDFLCKIFANVSFSFKTRSFSCSVFCKEIRYYTLLQSVWINVSSYTHIQKENKFISKART